MKEKQNNHQMISTFQNSPFISVALQEVITSSTLCLPKFTSLWIPFSAKRHECIYSQTSLTSQYRELPYKEI